MVRFDVIYEPKGPAKEYSAWACNLVKGAGRDEYGPKSCSHGCLYCYNKPGTAPGPVLKDNVIARLKKDLPKLKGIIRPGERLEFTFVGDLYDPKLGEGVARECLLACKEAKIPFQVLTKNGILARNDFDLYGPDDLFGVTLTCDNDADSLKWEPGASLWSDRIDALKLAKEKKIATWVSFEPVVDPKQTLHLIELVTDFADKIKVGKMNSKGMQSWHNEEIKAIAGNTAWKAFGLEAIRMLKAYGNSYYIKDDLLKYLPGEVSQISEEIAPDELPLSAVLGVDSATIPYCLAERWDVDPAMTPDDEMRKCVIAFSMVFRDRKITKDAAAKAIGGWCHNKVIALSEVDRVYESDEQLYCQNLEQIPTVFDNCDKDNCEYKKWRLNFNASRLNETKQKVIAKKFAPEALPEPIEDDGKKKISLATRLVQLAKKNCVELWHTPEGRAYITLSLNNHKEYKIIDSKPVKTWISRLASDFLLETVSSNNLKSVITLLEGQALYDGKEYELHVRKAEVNGKIYVDIGDSAWRVIEISKEGWRIIDDCPIRFYRPKSLLALPEPMIGGNIEEIKKLVNISKKEAWIKYTAWLSQAFWCRGPFVHLFVRGPQGSAKSALAETSKDLIDPSRAPRRHLPQSPRELMMACQNESAPSFDNVSEFSDLIADTLCTVSTGGSSAARELYTDSDEALVYAKNPIIMNGIADPSQRGDLLDRLMILDLDEIEEKDRISEKEMNKRRALLYPQLLGCILDATVTGLLNEDIVKLTGSPRMADFTEWAVACSQSFSWEPETFLRIYQSARAEAQNEMASANRVLRSIRLFLAMDRKDFEYKWEGQASELLDCLNHREAIMEGREPEGWPRSPKTMGDEIRRLEVSAKGVGIKIGRRRSNGKNLISLSVCSVQEQLPEVSEDELNKNIKGSNSVSSVYSVSSFRERLIEYRSKTSITGDENNE